MSAAIKDQYSEVPRYQKRYALRQQERGRCTHCTEQHLPGKTLCEKHAKLNRKYAAACQAKRRAREFGPDENPEPFNGVTREILHSLGRD